MIALCGAIYRATCQHATYPYRRRASFVCKACPPASPLGRPARTGCVALRSDRRTGIFAGSTGVSVYWLERTTRICANCVVDVCRSSNDVPWPGDVCVSWVGPNSSGESDHHDALDTLFIGSCGRVEPVARGMAWIWHLSVLAREGRRPRHLCCLHLPAVVCPWQGPSVAPRALSICRYRGEDRRAIMSGNASFPKKTCRGRV